MTTNIKYNNNIAYYRNNKGYTQKQLCERLGWKLRKLQSYEQGVRNISALDAIRLADELGTTVIDMLNA